MRVGRQLHRGRRMRGGDARSDGRLRAAIVTSRRRGGMQNARRARSSAIAILLAACGSDPAARPTLELGAGGPARATIPDRGLPVPGSSPEATCDAPREGCACDPERDAPVECHSPRVVADEHGRLRCLVGERACDDGVWGTCVYETAYALPSGNARGWSDAPSPCMNCDPSCFEIEDDYAPDPGDLSGRGFGVSLDGGAPGLVMT